MRTGLYYQFFLFYYKYPDEEMEKCASGSSRCSRAGKMTGTAGRKEGWQLTFGKNLLE